MPRIRAGNGGIKRNEADELTAVVHVKMTAGDEQRLIEIALAEDRSVPGQLRHIIRKYLAEYDTRKGQE